MVDPALKSGGGGRPECGSDPRGSGAGQRRLRLAFMGTPEFAVPTLEALLAAGHEVACVYCQPPRPSGRGHRVQPAPVHAVAERHGLMVRTPVTLRTPEAQAEFAALELDAAVVVAYGLILPRSVLAAPRHGCLNVHASLLPRWRGAAPIQRALLAGDQQTGVTIMVIEPGLDTGPMLLAETVPIGPETTAAELHDLLAELGARLIRPALAGWVAGTLAARPQPAEGITYAAKLSRDDGRLCWAAGVGGVLRTVRALNPWPGAWFEVDGVVYKVLAAEPVGDPLPDAPPRPGTLLDDRLTVACTDGAVRLTLIQRPGRAAVDGAAFLRGCSWRPGRLLSPL